MNKLATPVLLALLVAGCTGGISKQVRQEAYPLEGFTGLRSDPKEYIGETMILGGEIAETRNGPDETTLVLLERPLGYDRRPNRDSESGGRFLAVFQEYLDPAIYEKGRLVTVAGRVAGTKDEPVGDALYTYVVLEGRELHLWKDPYQRLYPYPYRPYPRYHFSIGIHHGLR